MTQRFAEALADWTPFFTLGTFLTALAISALSLAPHLPVTTLEVPPAIAGVAGLVAARAMLAVLDAGLLALGTPSSWLLFSHAGSESQEGSVGG